MHSGTFKFNPGARFTASLTKRIRRRWRRDGSLAVHVRFVVNYRDRHGKRRQIFFGTRQDAVAYRDTLIARVHAGDWGLVQAQLTLSSVLDHWLAETRLRVRPATLRSYRRAHAYIIGPLYAGSAQERRRLKRQGSPVDAPTLALLGDCPLHSLTTARIRQWHGTLVEHVGRRTAHEMKRCLGAALRLAAEDFDITVPTLPSPLHRGRDRQLKTVLTPTQVRHLLDAAQADPERGVYYAFPFLTGVRPSEQLGLLWDVVDLDGGSIDIRRVQELDGTLTEATKTAGSYRRIPLPPLLTRMLHQWRDRCPVDTQGLRRVFPTLGRAYQSGRVAREGLPLSYYNFRANYWKPALDRCGLPYVTPHSARHTYISTLQAAGIEVALVAKLVGHVNANVTLSHYTHAMRGGEVAVQRLQAMYAGMAD